MTTKQKSFSFIDNNKDFELEDVYIPSQIEDSLTRSQLKEKKQSQTTSKKILKPRSTSTHWLSECIATVDQSLEFYNGFKLNALDYYTDLFVFLNITKSKNNNTNNDNNQSLTTSIYKISACWEDRECGDSFLELVQVLRPEELLGGRKKSHHTKEVFPSNKSIIVNIHSEITKITHCTVESTSDYNNRSVHPMNAFHCSDKEFEKIVNFKGKKRLSYDDFNEYKPQNSSQHSNPLELMTLPAPVGSTQYQTPSKKRKSIELDSDNDDDDNDYEQEKNENAYPQDINVDNKMNVDTNNNNNTQNINQLQITKSPSKRLKKLNELVIQDDKQYVNNNNMDDDFELADYSNASYSKEMDLFDDNNTTTVQTQQKSKKKRGPSSTQAIQPVQYSNIHVLLSPSNNIIYKGVKYERKPINNDNNSLMIVSSGEQKNIESNRKWISSETISSMPIKKALAFDDSKHQIIDPNPMASENYNQVVQVYRDALKRYQQYKENIPSSEDEDDDYNDIVQSQKNITTSELKSNTSFKRAELEFDYEGNNPELESKKKKNSIHMNLKSTRHTNRNRRRKRGNNGYFIDDVQSDSDSDDMMDGGNEYEINDFVVDNASDVEADEKEMDENHEDFERKMKSMKKKELRELNREREKQQLLKEYDEDNDEEDEEIIVVNKKKSSTSTNRMKKNRIPDDKEIDDFINSEINEKKEKKIQQLSIGKRDVTEDVNSQVKEKFIIYSQSRSQDLENDSDDEENLSKKNKSKKQKEKKKKKKNISDSDSDGNNGGEILMKKPTKPTKPQPPNKPQPPQPNIKKNSIFLQPKLNIIKQDLNDVVDLDKEFEVITTTIGKGSKKQIKSMVKGPIDIDSDEPILLTQDKPKDSPKKQNTTTTTTTSSNIKQDSNLIKSNYQNSDIIKKQVDRIFTKKFTVRESFDIFIQYIVSCVLDDEFMYSIIENEDENGSLYFFDSIKKIQDLVVLKKDLLVRSSVWQPEFFKELSHRPFYHSQEVDGIEGNCKSCKRTKHSVSILIHLSGKSYDVNDFWSGLFHNPKRMDEKEEKSIKFELGSFCFKRSNLFHQLHHYPYSLFRQIKKDTRSYQDKHPNTNPKDIVHSFLSNPSIMDSYFNKLQSLLKSADEIGGL